MSYHFKTGTVVSVDEQRWSDSYAETSSFQVRGQVPNIRTRTVNRINVNIIVDVDGVKEKVSFEQEVDCLEGHQVTLSYDKGQLIAFQNDTTGQGFWMVDEHVGYETTDQMGTFSAIFSPAQMITNIMTMIGFTFIGGMTYFFMGLFKAPVLPILITYLAIGTYMGLSTVSQKINVFTVSGVWFWAVLQGFFLSAATATLLFVMYHTYDSDDLLFSAFVFFVGHAIFTVIGGFFDKRIFNRANKSGRDFQREQDAHYRRLKSASTV